MKKTIAFALLLAAPALGMAQKVTQKQLLQDVQILSADSLQGRLSGSEGSAKAQRYLLQRFRQIGLKPFGDSYAHQFRIDNKRLQVPQATNLIGYIPGTSGQAIVVTAHYDHVGERQGAIYNGADDNASGVGALLAAAEYFSKHKPKHTLIFAALDGEEVGLQGAKAFLENPPIPLQDIRLNVNMDMLSINDKGELYASGTYHNPALKPLLEKVKARPNAKLRLGHDQPEQGHDDWTGQSDHYVFHKQGIPFVYFGVEDHPHYHQPTDDFENVNQAFYADAAALVLDFLRVADRSLQGKTVQEE